MTEYCRLVAVALRELHPDQRRIRLKLVDEKQRRAIRTAYRELYGEEIDPELQAQ